MCSFFVLFFVQPIAVLIHPSTPLTFNIVSLHRQEFSLCEYDTDETILCVFTGGGSHLVNQRVGTLI